MKIAIVPSADLSYNSGSIIYAKNLFRYLRDRGDDAFMIGSKPPNDMPSDLLRFIHVDQRILEHPIIVDRPISNTAYLESIFATLGWLTQLNDDIGLDLIHAHYASFTSFAAYIVRGLFAVPYIVSSFGRDVNIGWKGDVRIRWLGERSLSDAAFVVVPERTVGVEIARHVAASQVIEIPMPLDDAVFRFGRWKAPIGAPIIATVNSCFAPEKGIATIIKAIASVAHEVPCHLVIAGDDDHPERKHWQALQQLVDDLGIRKSVTFAGYLQRSDVGELLRSALVLVDARLKGNFSSVLLEALCSGTPVISSNYAGSREFISDGTNGLLFSQGDSDQLAHSLLTVLRSSENLEGLRRSVEQWRQQNQARYSSDGCFAQVRELYRTAVSQSGKAVS